MKTDIIDILKKNFGILLIGALFLIFYFNGCGARAGRTTTDTVSHTTQVLQPIVVNPEYVPQQKGSTTYVQLPGNAQGVIPASTMDSLISQVRDLSNRIEALGKQYYAIKHYEDSISLKDTAGNNVGVVNLKQIVSENTLQSTQPSYQLKFPHTTTTITKTVYPKLKNQVYAGLNLTSLLNNPNFQQVDVGLMLKNKKDGIFSVAGTYDFKMASTGVRLGFYKKISFKQ